MPSSSARPGFASRASAATASSEANYSTVLAQSYNALGEYRQAIALLEKSLEFTADNRGTGPLRPDRQFPPSSTAYGWCLPLSNVAISVLVWATQNGRSK